MGAMYAVYDTLKSSEEIAKVGIEAGCEFDKNSSKPYDFHNVTLLK